MKTLFTVFALAAVLAIVPAAEALAESDLSAFFLNQFLKLKPLAADLNDKIAALDAHHQASLAALAIVFLMLAGSMVEPALRRLAHMIVVQVPRTILGEVVKALILAIMAILASITWLAGPAELVGRFFH